MIRRLSAHPRSQREHVRGISTNETGPDNPDGAWRAHQGDMFVQATLPNLSLGVGASVRLAGDNRLFDNIVYGRVALSV